MGDGRSSALFKETRPNTKHRARTEGQEAKRPPRGGGSGAAKSEIWHFEPDLYHLAIIARLETILSNLQNNYEIRKTDLGIEIIGPQ